MSRLETWHRKLIFAVVSNDAVLLESEKKPLLLAQEQVQKLRDASVSRDDVTYVKLLLYLCRGLFPEALYPFTPAT